jgi:hypothetical protein
MKKKQSFLDVLDHRLAAMPEATRLVIALDPRRMIDAVSPFQDKDGREWQVFYYDRNDLDLRSFLPKLQISDQRLFIIVQGTETASSSWNVDLSYIPDLVEEATEIIDCSPAGALADLINETLPDSLFEEPLLSLWSHQIDDFIQNHKNFRKSTGVGKAMNRFDAMAVALATSNSELGIDILANLPTDPIDRIIDYLHLAVETEMRDGEMAVLTDMIRGSSPGKIIEAWTGIEKTDLMRFVYLGMTADRFAFPQGTEALRNLGFLAFNPEAMGETPEIVWKRLRQDRQFLQALTSSVEEAPAFLKDVEKLVSLFSFGSFEDGLQSFAAESAPAVAICMGRRLIEWIMPLREGRSALANWAERSSLERDTYPKSALAPKARRYRDLIQKLCWMEGTLAHVPPPAGSLSSLMQVYREAGIHLLEMKEAELLDILRLLKDKAISDLLKPYLQSLRERIQDVLDRYDQALSGMIQTNFSAYQSFSKLNTQILRNLIQAGHPRKERVWIIILDGMRLDTWDAAIWPRLREHFELDGSEQLYLATLPSFTDISRLSFIAGKLPPHWKDYHHNSTSDHNILLSRHLGLGKDESKKKLKIVARVEEKTEQTELDFDAAQYCCLIFNISDDWIHSEQGSLVQVNGIVRDKFEKMVFPELIDKVKSGDIVVVTSDHGFIELKKNRSIQIKDLKMVGGIAENIKYRYLTNGTHDQGIPISYDKAHQWCLAVGSSWFERPKPTGKTSRYAHGGISLAEMVVPAVRISKRPATETGLLLEIMPPLPCTAGESIKLPVKLENLGTMKITVSLSCLVSGRLAAQESVDLSAGAPYTWLVPLKADPKANQATITAQYTVTGKGKKTEKRHVTIPIKDVGTKVEIDTSALDVFENM